MMGELLTASDVRRDRELARIAREFLKGCSCSSPGRPFECADCTKGFVEAALSSELKFGAKRGTGTGSGGIDHNCIPKRDSSLAQSSNPSDKQH